MSGYSIQGFWAPLLIFFFLNFKFLLRIVNIGKYRTRTAMYSSVAVKRKSCAVSWKFGLQHVGGECYSLCGHCSLVQLSDWRSRPWQSLPPVPGEGWVHSLLLHIEQSAPQADHLLHSLQPPSTAETHNGTQDLEQVHKEQPEKWQFQL